MLTVTESGADRKLPKAPAAVRTLGAVLRSGSRDPVSGVSAALIASRTRVRAVSFEPSGRARMVNRIMRWMLRAPNKWLFDPSGLLRIRRRLALLDRLGGILGIGKTERVGWHRSSVNGGRVRVVRPEAPNRDRQPEPGPVLLYLHGGAFLLRMLNGHMNLACAIARAGDLSEAVLPIYRLAPECPFPAAIDDCTWVYRGLLARGIPGRRIVVAGDSAGGGLVLKLLMRLREAQVAMPACAILISPFTDMSCSGDSIIANAGVDPMFGGLETMHARFYLGSASAVDPRCSPVFGEFTKLPPVLAQVGSTERLLDDSLRLVPWFRRAGGALEVEVWNQMPHVWHALGLPESTRAIDGIGRFIRRYLRVAPLADDSPPTFGAASSARAAQNNVVPFPARAEMRVAARCKQPQPS